jgi:predicted DCC family thiol-disulfide oxidoreductase YuxK
LSFELPAMIVYFDGSCPLCRAEIAYYRRQEGASGLCFRDVSQAEGSVEPDLSKEAAMARFHVRRRDGQLVSGAAAFASLWRLLPRWRWASRVAAFPGMLLLLEVGYRLFLPARPALASVFGTFQAWRRR